MRCKHCKQTFSHSHLTKEDDKYISYLFNKIEEQVPRIIKDRSPCSPSIAIERERKYKDQSGDRNNAILSIVNEQLIAEGKRIRFPVPETTYPYEKYL
jgi:hypothetical protein